MSEHSDSDIIDGEEPMDEYFQENQETQKSQNKTKNVKYSRKIKRFENSTDLKILTNVNPNPLSTKAKGVGKKSKGKENQANKNDEQKEQKSHESDNEDGVDLFMRGKNMTTRQDSTTKDKDEPLPLEQTSKDIFQDEQEVDLAFKEVYKLNDTENQVNNEDKKKTDIRHIVRANGHDIEKDLENKDIQEEDTTMKEIYKVNDSVLVRYLVRKKWRYYIGLIEAITMHEETCFSINFLKMMKSQQQLTFMMTKKKIWM